MVVATENPDKDPKNAKNSLREAMFGPSLLAFAFTTISHIGCYARNWMGAGGGEDGLKSAESVAAPFLKATARAEKTRFALDEPIFLRFTLENESENAVALEFRSGQSFDFCATLVGSKNPVWRWSDSQKFTRTLRSQTVAHGKKLEFEAIWEGAKAGKYAICAKLTADTPLCAPIFEIEVI